MTTRYSDHLVQLRQELHRHPERSGEERETAQRIAAFLRKHAPSDLLTGLGGEGVAAIYQFAEAGPTVMIRAELDALPIMEVNTFAHRSAQPGVSHKCGHDGHMTIVAGLAPWLQAAPLGRGRVVLLFQPAEETGQGAAALLEDERFATIAPDYIFALHNIPGYPLHHIIWVEQQFTATVQSLAIELQGLTSHAAEPERGRNPALALADLLQRAQALVEADKQRTDFALLTPVHARLGQRDYGISAGEAELHFTLRCWTETRMREVASALELALRETCLRYGLQYNRQWLEYFPSVVNDETSNQLIREATGSLGFTAVQQLHPFKFGEDFGWFTRRYRGAMFGLGAGLDSPALHHPDYDFPDELIPTGLALFQFIIQRICGNK